MKLLLFPLLFCSLFLKSNPGHAQDSLKFPVPRGNPKQLFFLQRSQNTNTVVYELNIKNGIPDSIAPVHIFWICYAEKSQKEELTSLQRQHAYGLMTTYISKDHYELRFLANKKHVMQLMKGPDHLFHVYDQINGKQAILSSIYLQINGGSLFSPHIEYIITKGFDAETGATVTEKTRP
jgi:Domain of unknown function (DUF4833)